MLVLDHYDNGTFRMSPNLKLMAFARERTDTIVHGEARPRLGAAITWTFYLESGVSRYLPLLGSFEILRFRESQNFPWLGAFLNLLALRDESLTMTAYRVEGFELSNALSDPDFSFGCTAQGALNPNLGERESGGSCQTGSGHE